MKKQWQKYLKRDRPVMILPIGYSNEKPKRKEMIKLKELVFKI